MPISSICPSRIHTVMSSDHATREFGFPAAPGSGDTWTDTDARVWRLSQYGPYWQLTATPQDIQRYAREFQHCPNVETARELRDAVELYLTLHTEEKNDA